jgi:NADH-quinone oxidoreductase subunit I
MAKLVPKPEMTVVEQTYVWEAAKGLKLTMGRFFKNVFATHKKGEHGERLMQRRGDIDTVSYPEEKRVYPERFRGVHRLTHRLDGSPRCVACLCCSTACPAQCIHIEAAEYPLGDARRGYERYPKVFVIDELRCIFCGYCVEACPCDAIRMDTGLHVPPSTQRSHFIFDKETLMAIPGADGTFQTANPRHEPGEKSHPGIDRDKH